MEIFEQWAQFLPEFAPGLWTTIQLTVAALAMGFPAGVVLAILVASPNRILRWIFLVAVEVGRGLPALIVLYLVYFGLPQVNVTLPNFLAAAIALAITTAAYSSEIFRAGIQAVPRGHREASRALGLSPWKELRLVVLPQALRTVIPPLIGMSIIVYQATSLAFAISTPELLSVAYNAASITFQFTAALTLAGLMYAVISLIAIALAGGRQRAEQLQH
jgi:polar amino acid transport system permease protein